MSHLLAIAAGGAVGAVLRFSVSTGIYTILGRNFPYGTLVVNVIGCFLMGFLSILMLERFAVSVEWRAALLIGVLGAFTTFSTFSLETLDLVQHSEFLKASLNITLSIFLCLLATSLGIQLARQL